MTDEWTRAEKRKAQSEQAKAIMDFVSMLSDKIVDLEEENAELKQQIEKMKCCDNCAKKGHICVAEEMQGKLCGKNKDKWELRRQKNERRRIIQSVEK